MSNWKLDIGVESKGEMGEDVIDLWVISIKMVFEDTEIDEVSQGVWKVRSEVNGHWA